MDVKTIALAPLPVDCAKYMVLMGVLKKASAVMTFALIIALDYALHGF